MVEKCTGEAICYANSNERATKLLATERVNASVFCAQAITVRQCPEPRYRVAPGLNFTGCWTGKARRDSGDTISSEQAPDQPFVAGRGRAAAIGRHERTVATAATTSAVRAEIAGGRSRRAQFATLKALSESRRTALTAAAAAAAVHRRGGQ